MYAKDKENDNEKEKGKVKEKPNTRYILNDIEDLIDIKKIIFQTYAYKINYGEFMALSGDCNNWSPCKMEWDNNDVWSLEITNPQDAHYNTFDYRLIIVNQRNFKKYEKIPDNRHFNLNDIRKVISKKYAETPSNIIIYEASTEIFEYYMDKKTLIVKCKLVDFY